MLWSARSLGEKIVREVVAGTVRFRCCRLVSGRFDVLGVRGGFVTGLEALRLGACAGAAPTSRAHEGGATKQFHTDRGYELPGRSQPGKYRTLVEGGRLVRAAASCGACKHGHGVMATVWAPRRMHCTVARRHGVHAIRQRFPRGSRCGCAQAFRARAGESVVRTKPGAVPRQRSLDVAVRASAWEVEVDRGVRTRAPRRARRSRPRVAARTRSVEGRVGGRVRGVSGRSLYVSSACSDTAPRHVCRWCVVRLCPRATRSASCVSARTRPRVRGGRRLLATWLILPVVICLSQRLSHACASINA